MMLPHAIAEFVLKQGGPVIASLDPASGEVIYWQDGKYRPAEESSAREPTNVSSAGPFDMSNERILKMRKQGYKVARIAAELGIPLKEVLAVCQASRPDAKHVPPTEEEIAERGAAIRRAKGHCANE